MDLQALIDKMTLEQKLAQMSQFNAVFLFRDAGGEITGPAKALSLTEDELNATGSVLNFIGAKRMKEIQDRHMQDDPNKIPLLFMQDVIHGYRTIYPVPLGMGATWDPDLMEECCKMAAKEASVAGVQVTFAPMVDLVRDCRWGRVMESTGEDPYLNCLFSKAQVRGFQGDMTGKYNIASCVKHFAAYGAAEAGRDYNTVDMSERSLYQDYLPAYKAAVDEGVEMLMTSFNLINGVPSSGNKWLVDEVLRKEWGFDKIVISDYDAFREMKKHGYCEDDYECAYKAIEAGTDIEMMSNCYVKNMSRLIDEGKVSMAQIDKAVMRILLLKEKMGLFENPYSAASEEEELKFNLCAEHRALCKKAALKSAVLLKNNGTLPLKSDIASVAVVGPFADIGMIGAWSCGGKEEEAVSVASGVKALLSNAKVSVAKGCEGVAKELPNSKEIAKAVRLAKNSDAVIMCLGEKREYSGEGNSRADVTLSPAQKELVRKVVKANSNAVAVLFNGRPLALSDIIDDMPAVMTIWQPGTEGGSAVADLVFGKANFEGRLSMSFPREVGQAPIYYNRMRTGRPPRNPNDNSRGYESRYLDCLNTPLFPFGYGLSYSKFVISEPTLDKTELTYDGKITASVTVKNEGSVKGVETVQLYICDRYASLVRPMQELKGYKKVELEAGEEKEVSFEIDAEMLKFYTVNNKFEAEKGEFNLWISNSAEKGESIKFNLV
ncbi:MAG: beta-glucosidase BglX [Clostridiales bacterium]|nr:beta-glucosidase BglX [Clostridiales bacterium]